MIFVLTTALVPGPGFAQDGLKAQEPSAEAKAKYEQGIKLKNAGKFAEAEAALKAAIAATPGFTGAHFALGWVFVSQKRKELAAPEFWAVRRLAPGTWNEREAIAALQRLGLPLTPPDKQPDTPAPPTPPVTPPTTPTDPPVAPPTTPTNPPVAPPTTPTNPPVAPPVTPTNPPMAPPVTPTNPPVAPPVTPTNPPVAPPVTPVAPVTPGAGGEEVIAPPEGLGPERPPSYLVRMLGPELLEKYTTLAAKRGEEGKIDSALAMYRQLLVFSPRDNAAKSAIDKLRGDNGEAHKLSTPDARLLAREVLEVVPPEALATWGTLNGRGDAAELKILLSPKLVGDNQYGVLRYPGCDPFVPVVLFTERPKVTGTYLIDLCGAPTGNDKALPGGVKVLTWGHIRAFVKADDKVLAIVRKMGVPTPPEAMARGFR